MQFLLRKIEGLVGQIKSHNAKRIHIISLTLLLVLCAVFVKSAHFSAFTTSVGEVTHKAVAQKKARLSEQVSVHAAGKGNPWITLSDGREVLTDYSGPEEACQALERNEAKPLSLCSADYDEDGVADLISGYSGPDGGGIITLLRGNIDSIYPNSTEAKQRMAEGAFTEASFLSPAYVFDLPEPADFIGSGDFDADGHWDIVAARRGGDKLYLLPGNGQGRFGPVRHTSMGGKVTSLTVGEINRRDGLEDVVVGVNRPDGSKVLVYEGPDGALKLEPEVFDMPDEITSLALGQLDDEYTIDLAVAAGRELIVVQGRDRKLSLNKIVQSRVRPAEIYTRAFSFTIRSLAIGDFSDTKGLEMAVLGDDGKVRLLNREASGYIVAHESAEKQATWSSEELAATNASDTSFLVNVRASSFPQDNIVVVNPTANRIQILAKGRTQESEITVESTTNPVSRVVSSELGAQGCTAILPMRLNSDALDDLIVLSSSQVSPALITTQATATFTVENVNDAGPSSLRQAMLDANANPGASMIVFNIPGDGVPVIIPQTQDRPGSPLPVLINPVTIDATTQKAGLVELDGRNFSPEVSDDFFIGLLIAGGNSVVRGLVINRFSSFGIFIGLNGGNIIEGNRLGTNATGDRAFGNLDGLSVSGIGNNTIGGTTPRARNLLSGNLFAGVSINTSKENRVQGNFIGTDITGTKPLGNGNSGIDINCNSENNLVGGTSTGARNLVSGNGLFGLITAGGANSTIICLSAGTLVQGNFIGTDFTGTFSLGNGHSGIELSGFRSTIGGTTPAARNILSGNRFRGIEVFSPRAFGNLLQGNFIGTDVTGSRDLGNGFSGVSITQAPGNIIGGLSEGARNLISGNDVRGIDIGILKKDPFSGEEFSGQTGASVQGNFIGTNLTGTAAIGNGGDGIFVDVDSVDNTLEANRIAFNGGNGINIPNARPDPLRSAHRIQILSNTIDSNGGLSIDLGDDGSTTNDFQDSDEGANSLQNFPLITSAVASGTEVSVSGIFNSKANHRFRLQFFHAGSCQKCTGSLCLSPAVIDTKEIETDRNGDYRFTLQFELPAGRGGGVVNCTATSLDGNTSEVSPPCLVLCTCICPATQYVLSPQGIPKAVNYPMPTLEGGCNETVTVCTPPQNTPFPLGITSISCTVTGTDGATATCAFNVRVSTNPIPIIMAVELKGKKLIVTGREFDSESVILINGKKQKTSRDSNTRLIGKKAAKNIPDSQEVILQIRNSDGTLSEGYPYTRP